MARDKADTGRIKEEIRKKEALKDGMEANGQNTAGIKNEITNLKAALTD